MRVAPPGWLPDARTGPEALIKEARRRQQAEAAAAKATGVCARPVISRVTDLESGEVQNVAMACGSTSGAANVTYSNATTPTRTSSERARFRKRSANAKRYS